MQSKSKHTYNRWYATALQKRLSRPYVHLLFGARQTGKSTLLESLLPENAVRFNLADPRERSRLLANPDEFIQACLAIRPSRKSHFVFVDEAQSVPSIFDAVQYLYDGNKTRWRFVLCGSSARKLRLTGTNLLPGRSFIHHLYPLTLAEHPSDETSKQGVASPLPFGWATKPGNLFPGVSLLSRLAFGELPGVAVAPRQDRAELLKAYTFVHLEEEIRREASVEDWGAFIRFLGLAASESGKILNYAAISQESGVSQPTVKRYYQLLEDMFVGFQIPALSRSSRKNLLSTPRYFFFDLGIRNAAAGLTPSVEIAKALAGELFEQWVGIELWKRINYLGRGKLHYYRTRDGAEIDFILESGGKFIPIEVKWTQNPRPSDARHLISFLKEYPERTVDGYIICRCARPLRLERNIVALPWHCL